MEILLPISVKCDGNSNIFGSIKIKDHDHIIGKSINENDEKKELQHRNQLDDDKLFLCVIGSCLIDKTPEIVRVKKEHEDNTYFNAKRWFCHE